LINSLLFGAIVIGVVLLVSLIDFAVFRNMAKLFLVVITFRNDTGKPSWLLLGELSIFYDALKRGCK